MTTPCVFRWDGDAMVPTTAFMRRLADREFVVGQDYRLVEEAERSSKSHRHFFAAVAEGHASLPEHLTERFPTPEHLRRYALIRAGYCDSHTLVCSSAAEARRLAAFIRPSDEFAVVTVEAATITRYVAKSQSTRAMGAKDFQRSKGDVLDVIAGMLDVPTTALASAEAA